MSVFKKIINNYKSISLQARASMWYTVCNVLQKGISFIIIPVYVRILTTAEYGQYSVFQSWRDVLIILATLNLHAGIYTKAMVDYPDDRDRYTSSMQGLSTLITVGLLFVYMLFPGFWNQILQMDTITVVLLFCYFVFFPAFTFWSVRQRVENKYIKMVALTLIVSVLTPIVSVILLFATPLREKAVIWGYLFVQSAAGLVFYIWQFFKGKVFFNKKYWIKALKFNVPLIPHYLSLIVLGQSDRIMIQNYEGSDKAGIYNLAYQISLLMQVITNAISGSLVPWSYEQLKNNQHKSLFSVTKKLCVLVASLSFIVILFAPEAIAIIGTKEYMEAIWIVPAVAASVYFTFCYGLFSTVEFYYGKTTFIMVASVIGAALNIILNAIFIPIYGFIAAGYTTLVCYFVFMIMHYCFMKKICRNRLNGEAIYDNKFIFLSCLLLCACAMVCMLLYNSLIVRFGILLVILLVAVIKRKQIMEILKTIKK